jgi:hypothetical protein
MGELEGQTDLDLNEIAKTIITGLSGWKLNGWRPSAIIFVSYNRIVWNNLRLSRQPNIIHT